jgi:hypothetical protein
LPSSASSTARPNPIKLNTKGQNIMINQETSSYNPRAGNGSAYDLMNSFAATQQQAGIPNQSFQNPMSAQQRQWQQQPWQQQSFGQPSFGQGFGQTGFGQAGFNQQFQQSPYINPQFQTQPYSNQFQQQPFSFGGQQQFSPFAQTPFAGVSQSQVPAITHRAAELKLKVPVHRIIGRHPVEVQQYLLQVVLPVLLDGLTKRAVANELGLSVTNDLRGEIVAEIDI